MTPPAADDSKSELTRARLIDAAGQVFAENGFQAATIRDICDRAGANVAAVNYHFRDKLGIYQEVFRFSLLAEKIPLQEKYPGDPERELEWFVQSHLKGVLEKERPVWWRQLMAHEMSQPTPALGLIVEQAIRPHEQHLRSVIASLVEAPAESKEVRLCAHSVIAQCLHYLHARPVLAHLWPETENLTNSDIDEIAAHISRFSLAAMRDLRVRRQQDLLVRKG
ncbi:MAG: CerR family C-terminal domain-containing protein [Bryobacteraceae bacterium]|nr:CerR family C-terminal domain-containing protein [Bryobacteraceae bacterium]